jgi:hypothetical protein
MAHLHSGAFLRVTSRRLAGTAALLLLSVSAQAQELHISVDGSTVSVDGKVVEERASQNVKLKLDSGKHDLKVEHDGFEPWTGEVQTKKRGEQARIEVMLKLAKAEPAPPPIPAEPAAAAPAAATKDPAPLPPLRLALQDLRSLVPGGKLDTHGVNIVGESLLGEVRKLRGIQAVAVSEVREMVQFEAQRQAVGACDTEECASEIALALGVDELVAGSVGQLGDAKVFTVRRLDLKTGKVNASVTRALKSDNGEELLAVIGPTVEQLFPERELRAGLKRGASAEFVRRLNPPPLPRWVFIATGGAAVAALAVGGVFAAQQSGAQGRFASLMKRAESSPVAGADVNAAITDFSQNQFRLQTMLFVAGGLALTAGIEALFTDWQGLRADEHKKP